MHLYPDTAHCFVCNLTIPIEEVLNEEEIKQIKKQAPKENIAETIQYIKTLPTKTIRGLELPYVGQDYFILWPDGSYYKRRVQGKCRYVGPKGHRPGLFVLGRIPEDRSRRVLCVVEGEVNSLSLDLAITGSGLSIVSPGSANSLLDHVSYYLKYDRIIIVVDKDPAGVYNGVKLRDLLKTKGKRVDLIALDQDFNDTLQQSGPKGVKDQFLSELGLDTER